MKIPTRFNPIQGADMHPALPKIIVIYRDKLGGKSYVYPVKEVLHELGRVTIVLSDSNAALQQTQSNQALEKVEQVNSDAADARRLDWIERKLFGRTWNGVIDSGSNTRWSIQAGFRHVTAHMNGDTFREAIDAAIKQGGDV